MILEPGEAAPCVEGHRFPVDRVYHDNLESDMPGSLGDLAQRMQ
jgi:hypothetical protein